MNTEEPDDSYLDESTTCDNCSYEAKDLQIYETGVPRKKYKFCGICSNTFLSTATVYPHQLKDDPRLFQSIGYIANLILDKIAEIKDKKDERSNT